MAKKLALSSESLPQNSTREPSSRSTELTSVDTSDFSSRRLLGAGSQMGGGSYKMYILDHLSRMHRDIEATTRKLELEQRRLARLEQDLEGAEAEYDSKRQRYKLLQPLSEDAVQLKSAEVRQVEKRLVKAKADLDKGESENKQLREQIDLLRRERELLNSVFKQLERGINGSRRNMDRLKTAMNQDKMVSEDAKNRTKALSKILDHERVDFTRETERLRTEVKRVVDLEKDIVKTEDQSLSDAGTGQGHWVVRGKGRSRRAYMVADEEEQFSEASMHRRILKLSFLNTIQRRHIKQHQKNIEVFEQAFATIRSSTGISNIEEIVNIFIMLEQRNFSLLTYVNQLNQDIEYVYKLNRELESQMQTRQQEEESTAARKDSALSDVSQQISKTKASTEEKMKSIKEAEAALDDCRPLISNTVHFLKQELPSLVYAAFEGDPPPLKVPTPDDGEDNLNLQLMYIEDAISQFKLCLSQPSSSPSTRAQAQFNSQRTRPNIPSDALPSFHAAGDDSDEDPETGLGDRPWTRSEMRERAQANIQKRRRRPVQGTRPGHEDARRPDPGDEVASPGRDAGPFSTKDPEVAASNGNKGTLSKQAVEDESSPKWWLGKGVEKKAT